MKISLIVVISAVVWMTGSFRVSEAIINGKRANTGQHPYQVAVVTGTATGIGLCGGSIISDTWVLTAAHCVYNKSAVYVKTGSHLGNLSSFEATQTAVAVIVHEGDSSSGYHDIALLKVSPAFNWSSEVAPITLAQPTWELRPQEVAQVSGWGIRSDYTPAQYLETITVPLQPSEECTNLVKEPFDPHRELCTFGSTGPCSGDSGSALTSQGLQIGIVVSGKTGCRPPYFSFYTRISAYSDWIQRRTKAYENEQIVKLILEWLGVLILYVGLLYFVAKKLRSEFCKTGYVAAAEMSSPV